MLSSLQYVKPAPRLLSALGKADQLITEHGRRICLSIAMFDPESMAVRRLVGSAVTRRPSRIDAINRRYSLLDRYVLDASDCDQWMEECCLFSEVLMFLVSCQYFVRSRTCRDEVGSWFRFVEFPTDYSWSCKTDLGFRKIRTPL